MPLNPRLMRSDTNAASTPPRRNRRFSLQPNSVGLRPAITPPRLSRSPSPNPTHEKKKEPPKSSCKVLMLGAAKVGKTSIIQRFLYNTFSTKYHRTIEELHHAEFAFSGSLLNLDVLDTAGSYEFPAMMHLNISSSDAFLLVFSASDEGSFDEIAILREQVTSTKGENVPIVLVTSKIDEEDESLRDKSKERVEEFAKKWGHGFVACSSKTGENITEVFKELLVQAKVQYKLSPALRKRRQSLPGGMHHHNAHQHHQPPQSPSAIPNETQLAGLRERSKRNSCKIT